MRCQLGLRDANVSCLFDNGRKRTWRQSCVLSIIRADVARAQKRDIIEVVRMTVVDGGSFRTRDSAMIESAWDRGDGFRGGCDILNFNTTKGYCRCRSKLKPTVKREQSHFEPIAWVMDCIKIRA